ncbi:putative hydrolase or acyltransferase of alpha/beta superfamily [Caulobacter sp. AP07]|uniref:alpha/beta fold hydrolase n=1 Tax=Caulobacter sp. AP07 TaxID=1144304 RepID=UPI0002720737|nr:alpha/beta hydrolase [Caulobacter sp. AP07]EJL27322.1 putative hydrolase or acyltransferase of alpha/beta superfamily [Caulobacter sp. AP07]
MSEAKFADYREASFIEAGGVRTAYRRQGSGEPVLFLHGAGLTRRWFPFYEALSKHGDLIAPEHPGFGESDLPDSLTDFTDMAVHYADLLKALDLEAVHLVGHSYGGWIAAEFAALYPEKIKSLTLIAPMGLRPPPEVKMADMFRFAPQDGLRALLGADGDKWLPYFDEGDAGAQAIQDYQEVSAFGRLTWNPRYSLKLETRLRRITAPTQIILPEHDGVVPVEIGQRYAELIPNAKLVTLKGASTPTEHLLSLQEPQRLADQIAAVI